MIFDKLERIGLYRGISPNLDTAIDFLLSRDLAGLPMGKTEISGSRVFVNKMEAGTLPASEKKFEVHRSYMDIQIVLSGSEQVETGDLSSFVCRDFSESNDVGFGDCDTAALCKLVPGYFTICMQDEPHKPGVCCGSPAALLKCVVKVKGED